jgi:hypothetical protein
MTGNVHRGDFELLKILCCDGSFKRGVDVVGIEVTERKN